ncbi:MAG: SpoIIE family protein phosphatase [Pirellulales bacterium]
MSTAEIAAPSRVKQHRISVLLVDDQAIIGEAVRRMLAEEKDIDFLHCTDPTQALATANTVRPTVILQDLVMPDVDGLTLVKFFRANPATRDVPMIVLSSKEEPKIKAEAFASGANDYVVKLPDRLELVARIRYHSKGYIAQLQRNEAFAALQENQRQLASQIQAACKYVRSLLPEPSTAAPRIDWRYVPCADLGGDTFGYHWLDDDHFVMYVIDVSGHGLDSALYAVTVMNVLRSQSLPHADFRHPGQVLTALNEAFPCEKYGEKFFTIWYGVYQRSASLLRWSGAGHPDGLLFEQPGVEPHRLDSQGPAIGMMSWPQFDECERPVPAGARLFIFSDGAFEIHKLDGSDWKFNDFVAFIGQPAPAGSSIMDVLYEHVRAIHGAPILDDDFSILEMNF